MASLSAGSDKAIEQSWQGRGNPTFRVGSLSHCILVLLEHLDLNYENRIRTGGFARRSDSFPSSGWVAVAGLRDLLDSFDLSGPGSAAGQRQVIFLGHVASGVLLDAHTDSNHAAAVVLPYPTSLMKRAWVLRVTSSCRWLGHGLSVFAFTAQLRDRT